MERRAYDAGRGRHDGVLSCSDGGTSRRMSRVSTGGGRAAAGAGATGRSNRERGDVRDRLRLAPGSVAADGAARPAIQHHARRLRACAVADRKQLCGVVRRPTRVLRLRRLQGSLHTHTHTLFPGLPGWAGTRKEKPIWILLDQETVSGSGIS